MWYFEPQALAASIYSLRLQSRLTPTAHLMVTTFAGLLSLELNRKSSIQVASVPLVGIDVHLEFDMRVFSHQQIFEQDRTVM